MWEQENNSRNCKNDKNINKKVKNPRKEMSKVKKKDQLMMR